MNVRAGRCGSHPGRFGWFALVVLALVTVALIRRGSHFKTPASESAKIQEVDRTHLLFREGKWYQLPLTNLFTGWMLEHYPDGSLCSRSAVSNGLLNGVSEGFYTNGQLQIREFYRDSVADGSREKWYEDGRKKSEATIVSGRLEGTFRSWHENGQLAEQIEMKQGSPDGQAWAFYRSGYVKAETLVSSGKILAQTSWEDGERRQTNPASVKHPGSQEP